MYLVLPHSYVHHSIKPHVSINNSTFSSSFHNENTSCFLSVLYRLQAFTDSSYAASSRLLHLASRVELLEHSADKGQRSTQVSFPNMQMYLRESERGGEKSQDGLIQFVQTDQKVCLCTLSQKGWNVFNCFITHNSFDANSELTNLCCGLINILLLRDVYVDLWCSTISHKTK